MKTKVIASSCALTLMLMFGAGCAASFSKRLNRLELGMTPAQAKKILGDDYVVKASRTDADGATLQMWEFRDKKTEEAYSIYFKDGFLAQWGIPSRQDFPELHLPKR
jgi:hypothetical protein